MNTFKKHIIASAVAIGFVGAAQAATSVTLYGLIDVGYGYKSITTSQAAYEQSATTLATTVAVAGNHASATHGTTLGVRTITVPASIATVAGAPTSTTTSARIKQNDGHHDDSRLGVKGQEDLGNGLSAIFNVEMRFGADTGTLFNQLDHSYVGLKGSFGEVTVGRRININDDIFGYASAAKELDLQVADNGPWDNNLSYRGVFGGLTVGADVTTGENIVGYTTSTAGANIGYKSIGGRAYQYAAAAEYNFGPGAVSAGYEHSAVGKNAYALGLKYKVGPVEMFGRVSRSTESVDKFDLVFLGSNMDKSTRATGWAAGLNYSITPNDVLGLSYSQLNRATSSTVYIGYARAASPLNTTTHIEDHSQMLSLDYTHSLSKRTSVYAGLSFERTRTSATQELFTPVNVAAGAWNVPSYTSSRSKSFNVGMQHKF